MHRQANNPSSSSSKINQSCGTGLNNYRKLNKYSQQYSADELCISLYRFRQYEYGRQPVPSDILFKMSDIFEIEVGDFFCDLVSKKIIPDLSLFSREEIDRAKNLIADIVELEINDEELNQVILLVAIYQRLPTREIQRSFKNLIISFANYCEKFRQPLQS